MSDNEAAKYVESVIVMRTGFTGEPPYVGWKGLGLALTEHLDDLEAQLAEARELLQELEASSFHGDLYAFNGTSQWVARRDDLLDAIASDGGGE
jgi:hypothetical protein